MRTPVTRNEGMMCEVPASGKHIHWELVSFDLLNFEGYDRQLDERVVLFFGGLVKLELGFPPRSECLSAKVQAPDT